MSVRESRRRPENLGEGLVCCWPVEQIVMPHARFCPLPQWALTDCKPGRIGSSCLPMADSTATFQADIAETPRRHVQQRPLSRSTGRPGARAADRDDGSNTSRFDCNASRECGANRTSNGQRDCPGLDGWGRFRTGSKGLVQGGRLKMLRLGLRGAGMGNARLVLKIQPTSAVSEVLR